MDGVEELSPVTAEPVQGVDDDGVAGPGVGQQGIQSVAVDGRAGLVDVDPFVTDPGGGQGVELAFEELLGGGDAGVAEIHAALRMIVAGSHARAHETRLRTGLLERFLWDDFRNDACPAVSDFQASIPVVLCTDTHSPLHY
nr:hypothetical protein [Actinomadura oligospora]